MNIPSSTVLAGSTWTANASAITVLIDLAWQSSPPPHYVIDRLSFQLLYHIDLIIISAFALIFLFRFPRLLARFWSISEIFGGLFLHHQSLRTRRRVQFNGEWGPNHRDLSTDNSHNRGYVPRSARRVSEKGSSVAPSYPTHVRPYPVFLRHVAQRLRRRITPGISVGNLITMVLYFSVLLYPGFYRANPFEAFDRYGWISISQYPFALAMTGKNNVLGALLGMGYEKLNFMHRLIGRIVVLSANIHALGYLYQWTMLGIIKTSVKTRMAFWGIIALICLDCLYFFSTSFWRNKAYRVFLSTHVLSMVILIPSTILHKFGTAPYVYATLGLLLFDHFFRLLRSRWTTAIIRPLPELGITHIAIPKVNAGWRAGQHVRLRVLSSGMGLLGWTEVHPFTIASIPNGAEGVVLMCKKAGDWTERLYDLAKSGGYHKGRGGGDHDPMKVKVWVEGPYGGTGHMMFASFSAAVFIVGGSGITFGLSMAQDLIRKDLEGHSRVKVIELIWCVQDPASLVPLLPIFTSMIQQSVFTPLRISIFYTRAPTGQFPFSEEFFRSTTLTLSPGRPKISKIIEGAISKTVSLGSEEFKERGRISGLGIGVCGPEEMVEGVFEEVEKVDPTRRDQVGGIEIHEETFGW
ncbi:hypothetical protein E1B28_002786 [Marasmius oreades]|uniref:ferric-chelate reductase (NADPH) n=1 Tax=Marasmius oreades TaxID=181124 RepID=A0A9P7RNQ3_9AGAR|nr:uncharacterized protein E1B28_002786 [Marasmius oreades]KAG7086865.1 hypothetical protein E1B28_002786 [Marasmius oreades]